MSRSTAIDQERESDNAGDLQGDDVAHVLVDLRVMGYLHGKSQSNGSAEPRVDHDGDFFPLEAIPDSLEAHFREEEDHDGSDHCH